MKKIIGVIFILAAGFITTRIIISKHNEKEAMKEIKEKIEVLKAKNEKL